MRAGDWDARYAERPLVWGAAPNRFVERELADAMPGRALDLACGEGRNALWLAGRGWDVVGVDFSEVAIDRARRRAADEGIALDLRVADVLGLPVAAEFDLVLVAYLQLPPGERATLLEVVRRALVRGGTFLLVAHDLSNHAGGFGGPKDPSVLWTPDEVVAALGPDFEIERAAVEERPVEDAPRPALDTVVRARLRG